MVSQVTPELVLSDVDMLRLNRLDLVRTLKRIPEVAHVPVVLMSGFVGEAEATAAECAAYIAKPFDVDKVLHLLPQLV